MRLKEAIQHTSGLRCVVEGMEICSSVGRRMLHEMTWLGEESAITAEHDRITSVLRLLETEEGRDRTETIRRKLALLRDIATHGPRRRSLLREGDGGTPVVEVCRQIGMSEATFYTWKKKYGELGVSELRKLR